MSSLEDLTDEEYQERMEMSDMEYDSIADDEEPICERCCNETAQPYFVQEQYFVGDPADGEVDVREVPCSECNKNNWRNKKTCPECNGEGMILK